MRASRTAARCWPNIAPLSMRSKRPMGLIGTSLQPFGASNPTMGRRQDFFREEFLSAIEILARGDLRVEQLTGSWAGAFGPTQFMPTSFKRFAVDFDGDGRRDVVDSVPDVVASTANNLKKDGYLGGGP